MRRAATARPTERWDRVRSLGRRRHPRDYAEQTYGSPFRIIRFAHRRRYELALRFIRAAMPGPILDYGAGDAHLIVELAASNGPVPTRVTLYEPVAAFAQIARDTVARTSLAPVTEVLEKLELGDRRFDAIVCLGVLEHMPLPERERFYTICENHLAPGGRCLVDVPVEVGPTLLVKEAGRILLKGRLAEYRIRSLLRYALGAIQFDPARFAGDSVSTWLHYHTGFDYRLLHKELAARFAIVAMYGTPLGPLPPWLMNQEVFFVLRSRADND